MNNLNEYMNHMEFSGYSFEKINNLNQSNKLYLGKNQRYGSVIIKPLPGGGIRFESYFLMDEFSCRSNRLLFLEMINDLNKSLIVSTVIGCEKSIFGSTLYTGDYNRETFGILLEAYHSDLSKIYQHESLSNFMLN